MIIKITERLRKDYGKITERLRKDSGTGRWDGESGVEDYKRFRTDQEDYKRFRKDYQKISERFLMKKYDQKIIKIFRRL